MAQNRQQRDPCLLNLSEHRCSCIKMHQSRMLMLEKHEHILSTGPIPQTLSLLSLCYAIHAMKKQPCITITKLSISLHIGSFSQRSCCVMTITVSLTGARERKPPSSLQEETSPDQLPPGTKLKGKTLVIKLGGSTLEHERAVLQDLLQLQAMGIRPVLVHGGGPSITAWLEALHIPTRFEQGVRVTDAQTLEVVCMVLRGQINERLVLLAAELGGKAVGLSGTDGGMIRAHLADERLGLVGEVETVDPTLVQRLLDEGYLPIIAPLGQGPDGSCLNINADLVAAHLAAALHADKLVFLSNVAGIYRSDGTRVAELSEAEVHTLIEAGIIGGGMIPKVTACLDALTVVPRVQIVDGGEPHILLRQISNEQCVGTIIVRNTPASSPAGTSHSHLLL
jgi:acetylglutamate kinase